MQRPNPQPEIHPPKPSSPRKQNWHKNLKPKNPLPPQELENLHSSGSSGPQAKKEGPNTCRQLARKLKKSPRIRTNSFHPQEESSGFFSPQIHQDCQSNLSPKRRRLPTLEEVLDAFEPEDDYLEPEPEPGDFWLEAEDWEME